jgi:hypothetical protein
MKDSKYLKDDGDEDNAEADDGDMDLFAKKKHTYSANKAHSKGFGGGNKAGRSFVRKR